MLTRRELLAASFAAGLPLWARSLDKSRFAAITDEIATTPAEAIAFARKYGLQWLELRRVPGGRSYDALSEADLKAASREFSDAGIRISFLNTALLKNMLPGTEPLSERARSRPEVAERLFASRHEDLRRAIGAAHILGVDKVRVFAFLRVADPMSLMPRIADILGEMGEIAAQEKIHLLVENESSCNVATCAELAALLRLLPSPWFGINWDPLNAVRYNEAPIPDGYAKLPSQRIGNVQIKGKSILDYPERLDWTAIFHAMDADGYTGKYGLENHIFGPRLIENGHKAMQEILRVAAAA